MEDTTRQFCSEEWENIGILLSYAKGVAFASQRADTVGPLTLEDLVDNDPSLRQRLQTSSRSKEICRFIKTIIKNALKSDDLISALRKAIEDAAAEEAQEKAKEAAEKEAQRQQKVNQRFDTQSA